MLSHVIIVNGPPGAGKSSVAAELRRLLPSSVAISGEALRAFAPADARAHLGGGATYRAAGALAKAYLELGAERVIFDYLFLRAALFQRGTAERDCAENFHALATARDDALARKECRADADAHRRGCSP
jgi:cytidylate kinase